MTDELRKGLDGVIASESALSRVDGDAGTLSYRGYSIEELARNATYEEIAYLLWYGDLPDETDLRAFSEQLIADRSIDDEISSIVRELATKNETPMAALRTAVSSLSMTDSADAVGDPGRRATILERGRRITAKVPTLIAAYDRIRNGEEPIEPRDDLDHAENFLYMLTGQVPDDVVADTFDMALVLHADHGLNASTFSGVVTASTDADIYSAVTSAIGTLSGSLHGGANQDVMRMLEEIERSELDPAAWIDEALEAGRRIPGFGHRVYNVKDPRAAILGERSEEIGRITGNTDWYDVSVEIETHLNETKGIVPNVDFYSASMYYQMGIPIDLYTPIFTLSRVSGWVAHVHEYLEDNRLIRPRARYVGPESRQYVPLENR